MRTQIEQYIIDRIRERREILGISQENLAFSLGFESQGYISKIESTNPKYDDSYNISHLYEIAKILQCSPKDFWPEIPL